MKKLTTQEAVQLVIKEQKLTMYAIAKVVYVSPIMVGHYKYGRHVMGLDTAERFTAAFGIEITDAKPRGRLPNDSVSTSNK